MKCPKCYTEIPDNMAFCGKCGTPKPRNYPPEDRGFTAYNPVSPEREPAYKPTYTPTSNPAEVNTKKKGASKVVTVVVSLIVFAVVFTVFSNLGEKTADKIYGSDDTTIAAAASTEGTTKAANSAYTDIFSSRFIVTMDPIFFGLDSAYFAAELDDGIVEKLSFGYENDIIKEMHDDIYIPVSDYTDEQKATIESNMKAEYAALENSDFAEVTYSMGATFFSISMEFKNLDNADNISVLADYGMFDGEYDQISMKLTRENLLASGFVER